VAGAGTEGARIGGVTAAASRLPGSETVWSPLHR
jgi:hypothetical protein